MSLYKNPQLSERMATLGVVDRFVRSPLGTLEHVVSLSVTTGKEGLVSAILSIDLIAPDGDVFNLTPLALYPLAHQAHAQEDALLVSRKLSLSLRRATPQTGWEFVRNMDALDSKDGQGLIITG